MGKVRLVLFFISQGKQINITLILSFSPGTELKYSKLYHATPSYRSSLRIETQWKHGRLHWALALYL